jgi:hypothetical protein
MPYTRRLLPEKFLTAFGSPQMSEVIGSMTVTVNGSAMACTYYYGSCCGSNDHDALAQRRSCSGCRRETGTVRRVAFASPQHVAARTGASRIVSRPCTIADCLGAASSRGDRRRSKSA